MQCRDFIDFNVFDQEHDKNVDENRLRSPVILSASEESHELGTEILRFT